MPDLIDYNSILKNPTLAKRINDYVYNTLLKGVAGIDRKSCALVNVKATAFSSKERTITFIINVDKRYIGNVLKAFSNSDIRVKNEDGALFISGPESAFKNLKNSLQKLANSANSIKHHVDGLTYNQRNFSEEQQRTLLARINGTISNPLNLTAKPNSWT
jgi:Zn-dependent M32 family carboxypeptidase